MSNARRTRFRLALCASLALSVAACGGGHRAAFCGLVHPASGFDPVQVVHGMSCGAARQAVLDIERDQGGGWTCARAMHAAYELDCRSGAREVQILEIAPVRPARHGAVVTYADWSFRLRDRVLQARHEQTWIDLTGPPYCVVDAPRPVLLALRLRRTTPHGGCFG
jgi:hypothetical protein